MQMFAHRATEAGIRRIQQERLPKPDPMLALVSEIQDLKRRLSELESKPAEVVYLPPREPHRTPFKKIEMRVCKLFGYTPSQLRSNTRNKRVVLARQFVFYWALRVTTLSTTQIGKLVGGLDHTTVLHGRDAYRKKRAKMGRNLREVR